MIDEMMLVFDSPGNVSTVFIIALLSEIRQIRGAVTDEETEIVPRVFGFVARSGWLRSPFRLSIAAASRG